MKKWMAFILVLTLLAGMTVPALGDEGIMIRMGMLSMLNSNPQEYMVYQAARGISAAILLKEGYITTDLDNYARSEESRVLTTQDFDSLDAMLMALRAGQLDVVSIYQNVASFICASSDDMVMPYRYDTKKERTTFAEVMFSGILGNDFSFLMTEENKALRDEFDTAIAAMKEDGTMDRLVEEEIYSVASTGVTTGAVPMEKQEGRETIRVAVTGALPPMDYVEANGLPAGFNTAVLAEIGRRLGKNMELVVVDSIGRATALSSGNVDVVFWTRGCQAAEANRTMSPAELAAQEKAWKNEMSMEEYTTLSVINSMITFSTYGRMDMPLGTICTIPYYSDVLVALSTRENLDRLMK